MTFPEALQTPQMDKNSARSIDIQMMSYTIHSVVSACSIYWFILLSFTLFFGRGLMI